MSQSIARTVATVIVCALAPTAHAQKNYKDRGEFEAYDNAAKDFDAKNYAKAIADLDSWSKKYPESDFRNDRQLLYVGAYAATNQPGKAIDTAAVLLSGDASGAFDKPAALRLLYWVVAAIQRVPDPSANQMATASNAARQLIAYDKIPDGVTAEAWTGSRAEFQAAARGALLYVTLVPIARSVKAGDRGAAENAAIKALDSYPESAQVAWYLGSAELCLYKANPEKVSPALYEFARAATVDPVKALVDPRWQQSTVEPYLEKIYAQYHGADPDGLKQLKELAVRAPLAPPGFSIKSAAGIAQEQQEQFERDNPEIALWMKIRQALSAGDGEQYFASGLKDTTVPKLRGVLLGAKPECRPIELLVAVRTPGSVQSLQPEIILRLAKPPAGKAALNAEIRWEGVATAFTPNPLMLTMETEASKLEGLKTSPCTTAPSRRLPVKGNQ